MTRLLVALVTVAAVTLVHGGSQPPAEAQAPAHLLQIDAVAFDRNGNPVADLRQDELEIWINGYRVPIETFVVVTPASQETGGRSIVLILDDVTLHPQLISRVREVARRFVNRMSPGDQMAIVSLNGEGMESTDDRARLFRRIDAYHARAVGVMRIDVIGEQVLRTIASISRQLAEASDVRKTIVGIGAEWLFDRPIPPSVAGRDLGPEWVDAMRAMAFANVNLYVIDPAGVGTSPVTGGSGGFAREAGGHTFSNTNDLNGAADRIMREAGTYYLIGVLDPPIGQQSELRELDVRVLRRGVTVRARRGIPGKA